MEYLKNVVVQLCCTRQQEALLPVVAQVLHLSPTEVAKCREAMARYRQEAEPDIVGAGARRAPGRSAVLPTCGFGCRGVCRCLSLDGGCRRGMNPNGQFSRIKH